MPRHTETAKEGQQTFASTAVASRRLHLSHVEQSVLGKDGVFPSVHVLACRVRWHHLSVLIHHGGCSHCENDRGALAVVLCENYFPMFRVRVRRGTRNYFLNVVLEYTPGSTRVLRYAADR